VARTLPDRSAGPTRTGQGNPRQELASIVQQGENVASLLDGKTAFQRSDVGPVTHTEVSVQCGANTLTLVVWRARY
jgi:hypothetical protein